MYVHLYPCVGMYVRVWTGALRSQKVSDPMVYLET